MLWDRMIRAAKLDVGLYNEVERDANATTQALIVVVIVALLSGIGALIASTMNSFYYGGGIGLLIRGIIGALITWAVWSLVTYLVGTRLFKGTATYGELLRCLGFAYTPSALSFLIFIPFLGGLLAFAGAIWTLIAMIIAIRESLDFGTTNAIITAVIGFVIILVVQVILTAIGLGAMGVLGRSSF